MNVIKRKGHIENFDERKLYASIFASCHVLRMTNEEAELITDAVTQKVSDSLKDLSQISSNELHANVVTELRVINPDAALLFDSHKDIS